MQTLILYIKSNLWPFVVKHLVPNKTNVAVYGESLIKYVFKCMLICTLFANRIKQNPADTKRREKYLHHLM